MLARMQRVEIGDAVNAEHHGLAVNDELPESILQRSERCQMRRHPGPSIECRLSQGRKSLALFDPLVSAGQQRPRSLSLTVSATYLCGPERFTSRSARQNS